MDDLRASSDDARLSDAETAGAPPLAVDLDGTLLRTDTLYETIAVNLFRRPASTARAVISVIRGRAHMKAQLANLGLPEIETLPLDEKFLSFLHEQKSTGRALHLATAAHGDIAHAVAARVGIFDSVEASCADVNMKATRKLEALRARFPQGFAYAGDSYADLPVWRGAEAAVLVGAEPGLARRVREDGANVEAEFPRERAPLKTWRRALRLHQWSKNLLLFAPLFLAHLYTDIAAVLSVLAAFVIMGIVASGTYLLNDLSDLGADRRHRTKKTRPFAAADLAVRDGLVLAPVFILGGLVAGFALSFNFGLLLVAYLAMTLAYSFGLKRAAMLDVFILGALYTLRVLMGVAVLGVDLSPWLFGFAFFFFFSLSLAKRHVELMNAQGRPATATLPGRGYRPDDWPLTLGMGVASAVASILIIALYLTEEAFPSDVYGAPDFLWAAPALILLWVLRIWLLAHRGALDDDPVEFAVKDRMSIALAGAMLVFFAAAVLL